MPFRWKTAILAVLVAAASAPALPSMQEEDAVLRLSLEDCIAKTLKNNLDLAAEMLEPELASVSVTLAGEKFMPSLSLSYTQQDQNSASFSFLDASEKVSTLQNESSLQLSQVIPTGGSFTAGLSNYMTDTNRRFQSINPRYGSTLRFTFSQPLLRDFGFKMSRREIIQAKNYRDISEQAFAKSLEDTVYSAESAYWSLVYSIENLKVRQQSLKLARELLEKNRVEIEAGVLPPIEILTAESDVATRTADILEAEAMVKNSEDLLKTIINLPAERRDADAVRIVPTDSPSVTGEECVLESCLRTAMEKRHDLQASRIDLRNKELGLSHARNQLFPDLRLQATYWSPGISGDQILYEGGNALTGQIIGTIPGPSSDAFKDAVRFKYKNWAVGLTLNYSLNNVLTRASYALSRLSLDQARLRLKNQEQQVFLEVKTAVRAVQTNAQRVEAYRSARELAQKKLEAEEEKFKVGLSTNYFILQYQRDLAATQIMELKSKVDYNISLANLKRVQGIRLENRLPSLGRRLVEIKDRVEGL
ncbi:MAG: TolC family protein [Candidatus Aminicenantes bacterium]|nr:TolC family protein [Candidatus Aminicenantes bacterium]